MVQRGSSVPRLCPPCYSEISANWRQMASRWYDDGRLTWRVRFVLVKANVLDPAFVLSRTSQRESQGALECGGLTPLSFRVSSGFCTKTVGKAERKKGTAKAASSHRTPKKGPGLWELKIVTFQAPKTVRKRYKLNTPRLTEEMKRR